MRRVTLALLLIASVADVRETFAQGTSWTFQSENDAYPSWGDDDYTNGLRLSVDITKAVLWGKLFPGYRDCARIPFTDPRPCRRTTLMFGQNFYSPHDITVSRVQETERPYSAWLYVGLAAQFALPDRLRSVEIQLGTTGKPAFGQDVQTWWHARPFISSPTPRGWANQIKTVPGVVGVVVSWEDKKAFEKKTTGSRPFVVADFIPFYQVTVGNVHDFGAAGATARFGYNLQRGWGEKIAPTAVPRVASLQPFGAGAKPRHFQFHVFSGIETRAVGWNALLQHDTYTPRKALDIKRGVADFETGVGVGYRGVSGGFRWVWRSPEFDGGRWSRFAGLFVTFGGGIQ